MLETLSADDFSGCIQQTFHVHVAADQVVDAELIEVKKLDDAAREGKRSPFSLLFRGPRDVLLEQRMFRVAHDSLGAFDIFLVPIGPDDTGMRFEAIFS